VTGAFNLYFTSSALYLIKMYELILERGPAVPEMLINTAVTYRTTLRGNIFVVYSLIWNRNEKIS
jgi:hypothetical protein